MSYFAKFSDDNSVLVVFGFEHTNDYAIVVKPTVGADPLNTVTE